MQKLWGGRFTVSTDALIEALNNSLAFDSRFWRQDIEGSIAHCTMLGKQRIIPQADADQIVAGLHQLKVDLESGATILSADAEDVHSAVEGLLRERLGPVAGKLHTARSRNDQVANDFRHWLRDEIDGLQGVIGNFQRTLLDISSEHHETILPGCTHMQHGQPVTLAHHLLAYFWMLERDRERLGEVRKRVNRLALGAGALAGTTFDIDRQMVATALGFDGVVENSLDAVSDRDFAIEFLSFASILMIHLSRLAEEVIIWNSPEFGYIVLDDAVTTGSSIMPQKKNPDVAELARGKAGRVIGDLVSLLTVMKGLPLTYNKDMQEDKEPVFDAVDTLNLVLPAMQRTLSTARFNEERMRASLRGDFSTATDLADYLVRKGLPFREAHEIVGNTVRYCIEKGIGLEDLDAGTLATFSSCLDAEDTAVVTLLKVETSVHARQSLGGTSPVRVSEQWNQASERLHLAGF